MITSKPHQNPKDFDVLAVDGIDIDWLFKMQKLPSFDEKLSADFLGRFPGGPVGNFACIGSFLGLKVASMCDLGDDEAGKLLLEDFRSFGVDINYVSINKGSITPFVLVLVDPSGEKAVIIPKLPRIQTGKISEEAIIRSRYVYISASNYEKLPMIAEIARSVGTQIMVDIEPVEALRSKGIREILRNCDIASFNQQGFKYSLGLDFSIPEAQRLLEFGPHTVVVTRGEQGAVGITSTEVIEQPAFNVQVKDTTGAGDTFNAAFLYTTLLDYSLRNRLRTSCAAAAILIQTVGTRTLLPTIKTVEEFLMGFDRRKT